MRIICASLEEDGIFLFPIQFHIELGQVDLLGWTRREYVSTTCYSPEWQQQVMEQALLG